MLVKFFLAMNLKTRYLPSKFGGRNTAPYLRTSLGCFHYQCVGQALVRIIQTNPNPKIQESLTPSSPTTYELLFEVTSSEQRQVTSSLRSLKNGVEPPQFSCGIFAASLHRTIRRGEPRFHRNAGASGKCGRREAEVGR